MAFGFSARDVRGPVFQAAAHCASAYVGQPVVILRPTKRSAQRGGDAILRSLTCADVGPNGLPAVCVDLANRPSAEQYDILCEALKDLCEEALGRMVAVAQ